MATPPNGTKLSLGKLGRATNVGNSDYTSKTSLNSAGRDSGTSKTSLSDFYISAVGSFSGVDTTPDESTNDAVTITFSDEGSLFASRIKDIPKCTTFVQVNNQVNNVYGS